MADNGTVCAIVSAYKCEKGWLADRIKNLVVSSQQPREILVGLQFGSDQATECLDAEQAYGAVRGYGTIDVPGLYETWNKLIKESCCDYITSANTDDAIYEHGLLKLKNILDRNKGVTVAYGDVDIRNSVDSRVSGRFVWAEGGYEQLKKGCFVSPMPMWRRSVHTEGYWFDENLKVVGDYDMWLRLARDGKKFMKVSDGSSVGVYTRRKDSLAHKYSRIAVIEKSRMMEGHK